MNNPLVSVIIPVFNVYSYVSQCLDSVICQTYQNIEVIIINDGSTDNSGIICDDYARYDSRLRVIHTKNKGLSAARNQGLENAKGLYLLFLDSDDWIEHNTIEILVKTALHYNADIVTAEFCQEYVDQSSHIKMRNEITKISIGKNIVSDYSNGMIWDVTWNKLYSYNSIDDIRFPDSVYYEDIATTWRILMNVADKNGKIVVLPNELFHFRMRKSSITHTRSMKNLTDYWKMCHERYLGLEDFQVRFIPTCLLAIGRMWLYYYGFSKEEKEKAADSIREMQTFSKTNFHKIMSGNYSKCEKAICLISQSKSPLIMISCFCGGVIRQTMKNDNRKKLFE